MLFSKVSLCISYKSMHDLTLICDKLRGSPVLPLHAVPSDFRSAFSSAFMPISPFSFKLNLSSNVGSHRNSLNQLLQLTLVITFHCINFLFNLLSHLCSVAFFILFSIWSFCQIKSLAKLIKSYPLANSALKIRMHAFCIVPFNYG